MKIEGDIDSNAKITVNPILGVLIYALLFSLIVALWVYILR
jgi:hypothetical protein